MTESIYVENFPNDWLYCVAIFFPHEYVSVWPSPKSSFLLHFSSGKGSLLSRAQAASGVFLLYAKPCSRLSHSICKNWESQCCPCPWIFSKVKVVWITLRTFLPLELDLGGQLCFLQPRPVPASHLNPSYSKVSPSVPPSSFPSKSSATSPLSALTSITNDSP